jgi:hypothetical protein
VQRVVGNKTEGSLIMLARDLGVNYEVVRAALPPVHLCAAPPCPLRRR